MCQPRVLSASHVRRVLSANRLSHPVGHAMAPTAKATRAVARWALAFAGLVSTTSALAQGTLQYDGAGTFNSGNGPRCRSALNVSALGQWHGASLALLPAPVSSATSYGVQTPVASIGIATSDRRPWRLEAAGAVGHAEVDCVALSEWPRTWLQLSRGIPDGAVAVAFGGPSLSPLDPSRDRQGLSLTLWKKLRRARVAIDLRAHNATANVQRNYDSVVQAPYQQRSDTAGGGFYNDTIHTTVTVRMPRPAFDFRTRVQFNLHRFAFDLTGGGTVGRSGNPVTVGNSPARDSGVLGTGTSNAAHSLNAPLLQLWGRANVRLPVMSFMMAELGIAALPVQPILGSPVRGVFSLGVGLAHGSRGSTSSSREAVVPLAFESVREDSTRVLFRIRAPNATGVQLSGEPTQWRPVSMSKVDALWWEAEVEALPGTYRINVSINGAPWQSPPGVPAIRDEFGGQVGMVTVR